MEKKNCKRMDCPNTFEARPFWKLFCSAYCRDTYHNSVKKERKAKMINIKMAVAAIVIGVGVMLNGCASGGVAPYRHNDSGRMAVRLQSF